MAAPAHSQRCLKRPLGAQQIRRSRVTDSIADPTLCLAGQSTSNSFPGCQLYEHILPLPAARWSAESTLHKVFGHLLHIEHE